MKYPTLSAAAMVTLGLCACTGPQGPSGVQGPTGQTGRTSVDQVIVTPARPVTRTTETVIVAPPRATKTTTVSQDSTYYSR